MGQGHTECAFGTGNALLRYGIDTRCAKIGFSGTEEMFGAKTRLLGYATRF